MQPFTAPFARMIPMISVMGIIFFLSHQPGDTFELPPFDGIDKAAHCIIYGLLAATMIFAFPKEFRRKKRVVVLWVAVVACTLYGISDEYHQSFIPGRFPAVSDVVADLIGAGLVCYIWFRYFKKANKDQG